MKNLMTLLFFVSFNVHSAVLYYSKVQNIAKNVLVNQTNRIIDLEIGDIETFCPNYLTLNDDEKNEFFAHLIASMAQFESAYRTDQTFEENNGNISTGLLQISYKSISPKYRDYGCANVRSTEDLKDPQKNIQCGLGIMTALVSDVGYLSKSAHQGASAYWSTLRTPYKAYIKSLDKTVSIGKRKLVIDSLKRNYSRCW